MSKEQKAPDIWSETPVSGYEPMELLKVARTQLLLHFPFFGRLAMKLRFVRTSQIPTAAVDPKGRFYYNPFFLNACTNKDAMFVVAHEVMHLVQRCADRFPEGGIHSIWNTAADIVVNCALDQAGVSPRDEWRNVFHGIEGEYRKKYDGWVTEAIYYDLIKDAKDKTECEACKQIAKGILEENEKRSQEQERRRQKAINGEDQDDEGEGDQAAGGNGQGEEESEAAGSGSGDGEGSDANDDGAGGGSGGSIPEHTCGNAQGCCSGVTSDQSQDTGCGDAEAYSKWVRDILGAAEGLSRGDLPGTVQKVLEDLVKPSVNWKDLVRAVGTPIFGKDRYTWKKRSRRSHATGVYLPHQQPESKGGLVFLDTSGSISEDMLRQFASECIGIMEAIGCQKLYLGLHDVYVYQLLEVGKDKLTDLEFARGGTCHLDVFTIANGGEGYNGFKLPPGLDVGMVICFTDLMSQFPEETPKWPVIWGVPSEYYHEENRYGFEPPFGRKVEVTVESLSKGGKRRI